MPAARRWNGEHLNANGVWKLIRDKGKFSPQETEHIRGCERCNDWVARFADMARKAGFRVAFEIPRKVSADPPWGSTPCQE
jgi:hypothetical protein